MNPQKLAILFTLAVTAAACGRAEFGTTPTDGAVVDSDVDRETPANNSNTGGGAGQTTGDDSPPTNDGDGPGNPDAPPASAGERAFTGDFAFVTYQTVADDGRNAVFSPHGLARSLIVAQAASQEQTAEQIRVTLEPYLGTDTYDSFNATDLGYESRESNGAFDMIGAVWASESAAVEQSFVDELARYTGLELRLLDFEASPEDARNTINNWYSARTDGRVSEVVGPRAIDGDTRFLITDAMWFAAPWGFGGFDSEQTTYANFSGTENDVQVPMMRTQKTLMHMEAPDFDGVVLPLGSGFTLVAIMPTDLNSFEAQLTPELLDRLIGEASPTAMDLRFPRIEVSDRIRLSDVASTLGLDSLVDGSETLAGFADDTMLDDAHQRVRISFDEIGVEATDSAMDPGDPGLPVDDELEQLTFDRPFFFAIRDGETGRYFLLGRLAQP